MTEKRVAANTVQAYKSDIEQSIDFFEKNGCSSFHDLTADLVKDFLYHLRMTLKISARSSSRKLSSLKSFSKYLQKHHGMNDFTFDVAFPKLEKNLPKFLTQDQIMQLFEVAKKDTTLSGHRNHVMITLAYVCGVRVSELIELTRTNVNFDDRLIHISGKGGKQRIIPLTESISSMLQDYLHRSQPYLVKNMTIDSDYLFPILYADTITKSIKNAMKEVDRRRTVQLAYNAKHGITPETTHKAIEQFLDIPDAPDPAQNRTGKISIEPDRRGKRSVKRSRA